MCTDSRFSGRLGAHDVDDEAGDEIAQDEAPVKPVSEGVQVLLGVLAALQREEGASQGGLEIAQHGIDPLERGQVARFDYAHDYRQLQAASVGYRSKAAQSVAERQGLWRHAGLVPSGDGLEGEVAYQVELEVHRLAARVEGDRVRERNLILRPAAGFAAGTLTSEVGIVELDRAAEPKGAVVLGHGAAEFMVQQPGGEVVHAGLELERQGRQASFGLAYQVGRQKLGGQRQFGVLHQASGRQRGLMSTGLALE